ncbi:hypothetical protein ACIRG5_24855 [Lentzea sp. NPDC102401]|uniref:hypothetical protein n=1 Tax=Lentzea sp. NPDC102401 TaxID=3364128 RepID=UPI003817D32B
MTGRLTVEGHGVRGAEKIMSNLGMAVVRQYERGVAYLHRADPVKSIVEIENVQAAAVST